MDWEEHLRTTLNLNPIGDVKGLYPTFPVTPEETLPVVVLKEKGHRPHLVYQMAQAIGDQLAVLQSESPPAIPNLGLNAWALEVQTRPPVPQMRNKPGPKDPSLSPALPQRKLPGANSEEASSARKRLRNKKNLIGGEEQLARCHAVAVCFACIHRLKKTEAFFRGRIGSANSNAS